MLLNPEILLVPLSSRVYSSAESGSGSKLLTHQRKTTGQVFILAWVFFQPTHLRTRRVGTMRSPIGRIAKGQASFSERSALSPVSPGTAVYQRSGATSGSAPLFIMCPHADYFYGLFILNYLINQSMLDIYASRTSTR
jgi:hypothetical protein